jgi:hypothetical protein
MRNIVINFNIAKLIFLAHCQLIINDVEIIACKLEMLKPQLLIS